MARLYCLDANVFIEPWNKYYSMMLCPDYWEILDRLGREGTVFCTQEVRKEIEKVDDDLKTWMLARPHLVRDINESVQRNLREVLARFPYLIAVGADRSMADPWVIAHAMAAGAVVVSKEHVARSDQRETRIKIPDVCREFRIPCINDFQFLSETGVRFSARLA